MLERGKIELTVYTSKVLTEAHNPPRSGEYEKPERLRILLASLARAGHEIRSVGPIDLEEAVETFTLVHDRGYVEELLRHSRRCRQPCYLDPEEGTFVSPTTPQAIAALAAVAQEAASYKGLKPLLLAVRPPGHHAHRDRARGYCIVNTAALLAELLAEEHGYRVALVDLDAHYGDGVASIFWRRRDVLYVSLHQDPRNMYPFRGFPEEAGGGPGRGYNIAIPLHPCTPPTIYLAIVEHVVVPVLENYNPDRLVLLLGLDTHYSDPLSDMRLTVSDIAGAVTMLVEASKRITGSQLLAILEGGYSPKALTMFPYTLLGKVDEHVRRICDRREEAEARGVVRAYLSRLSRTHGSVWRQLEYSRLASLLGL